MTGKMRDDHRITPFSRCFHNFLSIVGGIDPLDRLVDARRVVKRTEAIRKDKAGHTAQFQITESFLALPVLLTLKYLLNLCDDRDLPLSQFCTDTVLTCAFSASSACVKPASSRHFLINVLTFILHNVSYSRSDVNKV